MIRALIRLIQLIALLSAAWALPTGARWTTQETGTPTSVLGFRSADGYKGDFADLALVIDKFWSSAFAAATAAYESPSIVAVEQQMSTPCGVLDPATPNAVYCPPNRTIYLFPPFMQEQAREIGDFAPVVILAHEWAHHIQRLLALPRPPGPAFELQADCLAGAFVTYAEDEGRLEDGDFVESINIAESSGDPPWLPQDSEEAHGTPQQRVRALLRGYLDGIDGCGLSALLASGPATAVPTVVPSSPSTAAPTPSPTSAATSTPVPSPTSTPIPTAMPTATPTPRLPIPSPTSALPEPAVSYLPDQLPLPHAACFRVVDGGSLRFDDVVARLADAPDAVSRLRTLGWQDGAFRQFGCDDPPPGSVGWVEAGVHVFDDARSAQQAVSYFAQARAAATSLIPMPAPALGDVALALTGPATNGTEYTIYASSGAVLLRVTGVSPIGTASADVTLVMEKLIEQVRDLPPINVPPGPEPTVAGPPSAPATDRPAADLLPSSLSLPHADCYSIRSIGSYPEADVVAYLTAAGATPQIIADLNWRDGAYVDFRCDSPPARRAAYVGVVVHRFGDSTEARTAVAYWLRGHVRARDEAWLCGAEGSMLYCVSAKASDLPPWEDARTVLRQLLAQFS